MSILNNEIWKNIEENLKNIPSDKFDEMIRGETEYPYIAYFNEGYKQGFIEGLKKAVKLQQDAKRKEFEDYDKAMDEMRQEDEARQWSMCNKCDNRIKSEGLCSYCV